MPQEFIETPEPRLSRAERMTFNASMVESLRQAQDGVLTKTSSTATNHIRKRIRENVFMDHILTPVPVQDGDLDRFETTDLPGIIEDMEPDQPMGIAIPFNDAPSQWIMRGDKFTVYFGVVSTPIMVKNVNELRTYRMDLRQVITDNMLKDLGTLKDIRFMQAVEAVVGSVGGVGLSGENQNVEINGQIRRTSYVPLVNYIQDRELNNGIWLLNRHTASEFMKWGRDEIGGDMAQDLLMKGLKAMSRFEIVGVPHLATIKRTIVPDDVIYQFGEQDYLGRHYVLQDTTMHVKKEIDMLEFHARTCYGVSVPGVSKFDLIRGTTPFQSQCRWSSLARTAPRLKQAA